ncbi:E3 ubiquitin-protein ligase TRIM39-like [Synchiropus picturatus]
MAGARSLINEKDFACSICLNMFDKPVSIPCGHNFCLKCLSDFWDRANMVCKCPICQHKYERRPELSVNTFIADMVDKVKGQQAGAANVLEEGSVPCGVCSETVAAAVKSCLVCFESYCERHLEPHMKKPILRKHKLIAPVEDLESRICKVHEQPLQLFCQKDKTFLCELCKDTDAHKKHQIVTVEEEVAAQRKYLTSEKEVTRQMLEERQRMVGKIQDALTERREEALRQRSYSVEVMTAVIDYIKRSMEKLSEVTDTNLNTAAREATDLLSELEAEIVQIRQKKEKLDEASDHSITDSFLFLEKNLSGNIPQPKVRDWSAVRLDTALPGMQQVVDMLKETVWREVPVLCDPDLWEMQQHAVDLTLDPDTADPSLQVSADRKKVWLGKKKNDLNNTPERFAGVENVLANEGFSEGKFYYETQVKDKTHWMLGVVNQSINRKGDIRLHPINGYWTVCMKNGEIKGNGSDADKVYQRRIPVKVGVFVDFDKGRVSFYDVDIGSQLVSFTGCVFKEKLFPIFSPGSENKGKNLAPLIITDRK